MTVFDRPVQSIIRTIAYGPKNAPVKGTVSDAGTIYRLERAKPYYRNGRLVAAVPQFRALTLYSPTTNNNLLPTQTITPTAISYPVKTI